jgi:tRNA(Ile)-lysidine synthase TilS/MesJ
VLLSDLRHDVARDASNRIREWSSLAGTLTIQRKVDRALRTIEAWRAETIRPIVSVSGGKDSTLLLQLCRRVDPSIPVIQARGPVPYSDAAPHLRALQQASGGDWHIIEYRYDVEGVLAGDVRYPAGLKQRELLALMRTLGVDGVAFGLRADESRGRLWNVRMRGERYRAHGGLHVCTPLARWTAEEVIGYLVATDRLPLHPVYQRTYMQPDVNRLRDSTWLPNQASDAHGRRSWLAWHYPEHLESYDRAVQVFTHERG